MRKLLFLAIMPLLFASCSSGSDDDNSSNESAVIGVWQETFYWDRTDWHTWGLVAPPVWEFKSDKTYYYYNSISDYQAGKTVSSGKWRISSKYLSTDTNTREYSFSDNMNKLTWNHVAIMKRYK